MALGALNETPLRWGDLSGWLDEVTLESALVEVARWLGIVLALYVIVVAALVLLSELAALVHAVPAARLLQGAARAFAVPALRRRLATASTATAITVSALSVQGGIGLAASPATAELTMDAPATPAGEAALPEAFLPEGVSPADVAGFDLVAPTEATPAPPTEVTALVEDGDTMWGRITAHYGWCDAVLIELVATASGIEDPNVIYTGQTLVFPALDSPTAAPPTPVAAGESTWSLHSIVAGDTLWDILDSHYGFVSADLVWAIAAYNGLADPSDVPIGTVITLPPLDAAGVPIPETVHPTPVAEHEVVPAPAPAAPPSVPMIETGPSQETVEEVEAPSASTANTAEVAPVPRPVGSSSTTDPPAATAPVVTDDEESSTAPWLVGISSALVLASGLLAAYRRLRRRQATAGANAWRLMPSGESARLHRALVRASDVSLVRWAGQEISGVLFDLGRPVAGPVAVELSDLTGIELLWDAPMLDAPVPWEATPGGWSWRLLYDPAAEVPEASLPAAIPGLVTFGRRHDAQVLVDLEAFGVVSLDGDVRAAEDVLRSIVLELGAGDELSDAWVSTVGIGVDGVEQLGRVQARTPEAALDHARGIVADERRLMDDAGVADTFVLRASGPATGREVTVIVVRAEGCEVLAELAALATPRSGLVVVALGPVDEARLRAVVAADGTVELEPLGVVVEGVGVSREVASVAAVLLDDAAELIDPEDLSEPVDLTGPLAGADDERDVAESHEETVESATPSVVDEVDALYGPDGLDLEAAGDLLAGVDDEEWEAPSPALLVRVFGAPRLDPSPPDLPRQERMVVAYVAAVGGEASPSKVRDAVWHGRSVSDKRFTNLVGKLRSLLGPEIVPGRASRDRSRPDGVAPLRLQHTMTDLDVFNVLAARAGTLPSSESLPMLLDALELVTGEPFDDIACEWPNISQLRWQASQAVETVVLHAVDLALAADDLVAARRAVIRGLVGLPGNEMLYRARMRIEAHAGNHAGVRSVYAELVSVLQDLGGGPHDSGDPSPATRQLFEQLVERSSS